MTAKRYYVRHTPTGEGFEVLGANLRRVRRKIEAQCLRRGWELTEIDWFEVRP